MKDGGPAFPVETTATPYAKLIALREREARLVEALRKLACLGNGNRPGNSDGNMIARTALAEIEKEDGE